MAQCKNCIHEKVCLHRANIQTDTYAYMGVKYDTEKCEHYNAADVVPKSEVEWLYQTVDNYSQEIMYHDEITKMKVDEAKSEVAREIFEEIEKRSYRFMNDKHYIFGDMVFDIAELKKKYTE